jgi:hypothetical protein
VEPFKPHYNATFKEIVARIKEVAKIVGFDADDAKRAAAIMESLGGTSDKKETTNFHGQLKEIYKSNWETLKAFNASQVDATRTLRSRRNRSVGVK